MGGSGFNARGSGSDGRALAEKQKMIDDLNAQLKSKQTVLDQYNQHGAGYRGYEQTDAEKRAGVLPPGFEGIVDVKTGQLLDQFKVNPFAGEASKKIRGMA